ncbi:capsule polysaccharide biosynthesis protein [Xylaria arbuscula]|nr:capsule polysaccharide biosynthesis protein [Xylaria arbuscula]
MTLHLFVRVFHTHTADKPFHPVIAESHASLSDIDAYKSNSTYLADLDISHSHLILHLLGAFKLEVKPYEKWLYIVTQFVEKGTVRPRPWGVQDCGPTRKTSIEPHDWEKKILTTAVTSHVVKMGRLTIHAGIMLKASGLLLERPGGPTANASGDPVSVDSIDAGAAPKQTERERKARERQSSLEYKHHFAATNDLSGLFDRGEDGALGRFPLG